MMRLCGRARAGWWGVPDGPLRVGAVYAVVLSVVLAACTTGCGPSAPAAPEPPSADAMRARLPDGATDVVSEGGGWYSYTLRGHRFLAAGVWMAQAASWEKRQVQWSVTRLD